MRVRDPLWNKVADPSSYWILITATMLSSPKREPANKRGPQDYNCSFLKPLTSLLASVCRLNGQQRVT